MSKELMDVLITTFPGHKSKNVGDNMIAQSALQLIKARNPEFDPAIVFREKSLDGFGKRRVRSVIAPGFSVSNGVYPTLFALYTDLERLRNFFPVGCSFQNVTPSRDVFFEKRYNKQTLELLKFIAANFGPLPCRDKLIVDRLEHFDIPAVYSGDLVLFDEKYIGTPYKPPAEVKSVAFTIQHHTHYLEQSIAMLKGIKRTFPNAKLYIAHHSVPSIVARSVAARANQLGFEVIEQFGDIENLERYNDVDLHIGYRLHGHITFLRKRKPSVLMVEDARAYGFSRTEGTSHGCIDAFDLSTMDADESAVDRAMDFIQSEYNSGFEAYSNVFDFIDETFKSFVSPHFDKIAKTTLQETLD